MGMINISTHGSFALGDRTFSAQTHGHARAVADAIKFLSEELLPEAIRQDHELHEGGSKPTKNFGKD